MPNKHKIWEMLSSNIAQKIQQKIVQYYYLTKQRRKVHESAPSKYVNHIIIKEKFFLIKAKKDNEINIKFNSLSFYLSNN